MSGSIFGKNFVISTWGESHGNSVGVCVDGCPAGIDLSESDIQELLDRRKPGQSEFTTMRKESDQVRILSGVFEGKTTGTPIAMVVENKDQHSKDYSELKNVFRPGHADFTFTEKFGIRDYRGGGRSSGRETIGRVAAGAVAVKLLSTLGISVCAYAKEIGGIAVSDEGFDLDEAKRNALCMPDAEAAEKCTKLLRNIKNAGDSAGGIIECRITGLKPGIGEPVFDKLDARLAAAAMSVGAVKGFEIGAGFKAARMFGSECNDGFVYENGSVMGKAYNSGGTLGGISDGGEVVFRVAVKPTPSISVSQETFDTNGKRKELIVKGRHDPVIVPRAVVVIEAMAALTVSDLIIQGMGSRIDNIINVYQSNNREQADQCIQ